MQVDSFNLEVEVWRVVEGQFLDCRWVSVQVIRCWSG